MKNELKSLSKSELISRLMAVDTAQRELAERLAARHQAEADLSESFAEQSEDAEQSAPLQRKVDRLTRRVKELDQKLGEAEEMVLLLRRLLFGTSRERYTPAHPSQLLLPFAMDEAQQKEQRETHQKNVDEVKNPKTRRPHPGRVKLSSALPVQEVVLDPEGDQSNWVLIGKEITEKLEIVPAKVYIKRYIRNKYAVKGDPDQGICIAELPPEIQDKSIAATSTLAEVTTDKYLDHLPLHRQQQRLRRMGIEVPASTLVNWVRTVAERLRIIYDHLVTQTRSQGYLQVDETPIPVLDETKKGQTHRGFYWVYYSPLTRTVLFDYQAGRGREGPKAMLEDFRGYLQTDGYSVYTMFDNHPQITHLGCWAHARRYFERALPYDPKHAGYALEQIQGLYEVERQAREANMDSVQRQALREDTSMEILKAFAEWIHRITQQHPPRTGLGKALYYTAKHWEQLQNYIGDGRLEIDNNLVENQIRPIALGRKNYLFAGSHDAAKRAAVIYTLIGNCKLHGVNPKEWLIFALDNVLDTKVEDLPGLYPQNYGKTTWD